jgi:hypothetical protein
VQLDFGILCLKLRWEHIFRKGASSIIEYLIGNLQFLVLRHIGVN